MRPIGRYILNGLTVLSLVLCVATIVLWVRSHRSSDLVRRAWQGKSLSLISVNGHLVINERVVPSIAAEPWTYFREPTRFFVERCVRAEPVWSCGGVKFERNDPENLPGWHQRVVMVPYWLLAVALLASSSIGTRATIIRFLARCEPGRCTACGYDLRATPHRCPECGTIPTKVEV